uniref:Uncharacterized protein n=1 Tax=Cacopsylla melanoneura TaxID=428564 RepID=A0A8D8VYD3_9HEMI
MGLLTKVSEVLKIVKMSGTISGTEHWKGWGKRRNTPFISIITLGYHYKVYITDPILNSSSSQVALRAREELHHTTTVTHWRYFRHLVAFLHTVIVVIVTIAYSLHRAAVTTGIEGGTIAVISSRVRGRRPMNGQ